MHNKTNRHLRREDREVIYRMSQEGYTQEEIARAIGFGQPTVSKELRRNAGMRGYRPKQADEKARWRQEHKAPRSKVIVGEIKQEVERRLRLKHSPEQTSGALKAEGKPAPSHESIYRYIAEDTRQGGDLYKNLRINGKRRYRRRSKEKRSKIVNRIPICERPQVVETRSRFGDWEADLVEGSKGSGYILSLYERKSRLGRLALLRTKSSQETANAIIATLSDYRVETITYDNGLEFSLHEQISQALQAAGYFCEPYHSWEKGGVENFNGLLRQYFAKGSDFSKITPESLAKVEAELNQRPRKVLEFAAPSDFGYELLLAA